MVATMDLVHEDITFFTNQHSCDDAKCFLSKTLHFETVEMLHGDSSIAWFPLNRIAIIRRSGRVCDRLQSSVLCS